MLQKRSIKLHNPQWGYIVSVPEGDSTTLNYSGLVYDTYYIKTSFSLYIGNPGNLLLVPSSTTSCKCCVKTGSTI
jgi:hypothetical protein